MIYGIIIGAAGATALRMLVEEIVNCIRYHRNAKKLAIWLAETHDARQKANFSEVAKFEESN